MKDVMTQAEAQSMIEDMLLRERGELQEEAQPEETAPEPEELEEARLNKRPVNPGKPWTQEHLRDVLVDAQMRLAGASDFGHALVKAGEWEDADRRGFENDMNSVISRIQNIYSNFEQEGPS